MIKEIQLHVKTRLAAHEAPREFEFMDEFPSTVTGKIMRRELRAREQAKIARSNRANRQAKLGATNRNGGSHDRNRSIP